MQVVPETGCALLSSATSTKALRGFLARIQRACSGVSSPFLSVALRFPGDKKKKEIEKKKIEASIAHIHTSCNKKQVFSAKAKLRCHSRLMKGIPLFRYSKTKKKARVCVCTCVRRLFCRSRLAGGQDKRTQGHGHGPYALPAGGEQAH